MGGAVIGAPVGPTGALCASVAMAGQPRTALVGGLGSAAGLTVHSALAAAGLGLAGAALDPWRPWLSVFCGLVLWAVAAFVWRNRDRPAGVGSAALFSTCLFVVLSNPAGFVLFLAAYAGPLPLGPGSMAVAAASVGAGVGTVLAFLPMIGLCAKVGPSMGAQVRRRVVGALAVLIALAGAAALFRR